MKVKGLLFAAAAAVTATGAARAADAIYIPEPEPMEYVRVCDIYGAGFFYIPGTETCLQISGYVWYEVGAENRNDVNDTFSYHYYGDDLDDGWRKYVEVRINFDARSETEWGTLRSYLRIDGDNIGATTGDFNAKWDQAFIELGGLRMGYTESAWVETANGGASGYGSHSWTSMSYGYQQRTQIAYNFAGGNGFFGTISLEDDNLSGEGFLPDIVGVAGFEQGWGAVWAKGAYDESDESWAASAGAQLNIPGFADSSLRVLGYYTDSINNAYGITYDIGGAYGAANWSVLASYWHQFSDTFGASVAGQYFDGFSGRPDGYLAELNLVWSPLENFEVTSEIGYAKTEGLDGTVSGFLRFQRYF